jgi:hypothetical protein
MEQKARELLKIWVEESCHAPLRHEFSVDCWGDFVAWLNRGTKPDRFLTKLPNFEKHCADVDRYLDYLFGENGVIR